jgi:hypothetical protein
MSTVKSLAAELVEAFVTDKRDNGKEFVHLKDGSPAWMQPVIRAVYGDKLPDDTVYSFIEQAANAIAESDDDPQEAIYELEPDSYTNNLTAWLHERADHVYYLTEAIEQFQPTEGFALLALAQKIQMDEVGSALLAELEKLADETE